MSETPENDIISQTAIHEMPRKQDANKGCPFKEFIPCRPKEYDGFLDPKVTIRWINEIKQIFKIYYCCEDQKVFYASQILKSDSLIG